MDCAGQSGGGPDNLPAVTAISATEVHGSMGHAKCRRLDLTTKEDCLDQTVCPIPTTNNWGGDEHWGCAEPFCYDHTKTDQVGRGTFSHL